MSIILDVAQPVISHLARNEPPQWPWHLKATSQMGIAELTFVFAVQNTHGHNLPT